MSKTIDRYTHDELVDLLEDSISYFCDEHGISAEIGWIIAECFAVKKQAEIKALQEAL